MEDILGYVRTLCEKARTARNGLATAKTAVKNAALVTIADSLNANADNIMAANRTDIETAKENGIALPMIDRLTLDQKRINGIAESLRELTLLSDPIGSGNRTVRPNGLEINCIKVPLGTVAIIYEARPNVTVDAAALCIKTGNACVLRGGKEAIHTNRVLTSLMRNALSQVRLSSDCIQLVDNTSRESSTALMQMRGLIDLLVPRGGKGLIRSVVDYAKVPVIETGAGNCHLYVDDSADIAMAVKVALNAKLSRPSVCNAVETILVHKAVAADFLTAFVTALPHSLEIRGCDRTVEILSGITFDGSLTAVTEEDYNTEYDDYIVSVKVVGDIDEAITHIQRYSTGHSEAIMTTSMANAAKFQREIDAAAVYVNASTRFTDGGEFGFGAELGISTQKLHARGPMGLDALTTVKYLICGNGQVR